jgi:putative phage-type endonuclease
MQIIHDIEQGTEEWHNLRLAMPTASRFKDVLAKGSGATRKAYLYQLAAESITGLREDSYSNKYMEHGTETEPQARAMYELSTAQSVTQVAFIKHDFINIGCSPDGLIGDDGIIEIKCPKTTTQIETYLSGKMPTCHIPQVQGQLWITERLWCDFISFDPRINGESSFMCVRVMRDDDYIKNLQSELVTFNNELNLLIEKLL